MFIDLLLITCIIVYIIDISGIIITVKSKISRWFSKGKIESTDFRIRPFDCSLCMTFWTCLIYIICMNSFTIPYIALVCLMSYLTEPIRVIFITINELLTKLFAKII